MEIFIIVCVTLVVIYFLVQYTDKAKEEKEEKMEAVRNEQWEREKRANPIYIASGQIYALATSKDNYFGKLRDNAGLIFASFNGNRYDIAAILDEEKKRKEEESSENTVELKTKTELLEYVDKAQRDSIRPEIVSRVLRDNIEAHFSEQSDVISSQITRCEGSFDKEYRALMGKMRQAQSNVSSSVRARHNSSGTSTGLGFGIITNSPSQAILYETMDAHERKKQRGSNVYAEMEAINDGSGLAVKQYHDRFINLFNDYFDKVSDIIKKIDNDA